MDTHSTSLDRTPSYSRPQRRFSIAWRKGKRILPLFTIVGLGMSIWNLHKSSESRMSLASIAQTMSTQYVAEFPFDVPEIENFIRQTRNRLDIVVDYAAYGSWSAPKEFEKYKNSLMSLKRDGKAGTCQRL